MPGGVHVGIKVLLGRLPRAGAVARVVVGEDVAVNARAQADVEAAHLAQVHRIPMGKQERVASAGRAAHKHAGDAVPPRGARHETLNGFLLPGRILPIRSLREVQAPAAAALITHEAVGRLGGQEGQLGGNFAGAGRTAEQATKLAEGQVVHPRNPEREGGDWLWNWLENWLEKQ